MGSVNLETGCILFCTERLDLRRDIKQSVEAGSNTSTVTLRVVGGDEKGSLKSETVKYNRENDCAGKGQHHI
jgi:hypothetical protein